MVAARYQPRILIPKFGQTGNVNPITANHGLQFAARWQNLDLKVSITIEESSLERVEYSSSSCYQLLKMVHTKQGGWD